MVDHPEDEAVDALLGQPGEEVMDEVMHDTTHILRIQLTPIKTIIKLIPAKELHLVLQHLLLDMKCKLVKT